MQRLILLIIATLLVWISMILPQVVSAEKFTYLPPGDLIPGSGEGAVDYTVYLPGMRFPIEIAPAYANSQVYRPGGRHGGAGGQCHSSNYSYPWRDNLCELREKIYYMPVCPAGKGHQGQDIRPSTCENSKHYAVAVEGGTITSIGPYSVNHQGDSGILHSYLHLNHGNLSVWVGKRVENGDPIGKISNNMGATSTTIHLHYTMRSGGHYIPVYMSLVRSYEELIDEPEQVESDVNGDGHADLVSMHSNKNAYVWPGNPDGTFGSAKALFKGTLNSAFWDGTGHWVVDVSDVNGDGYADLVSVHSNKNAYVWPGQADGTFGKAVADFNGTFKSAMSDGIGHEVIAVADVTGDGKGDLVSLYQGSAYVYPGTANGDFAGGISSFNGSLNSAYFDGTAHWVVDVADVNGDGYADLVSVHTNGYAYVWPGSANGTFGKVMADFNGTLNSAMHDGSGHELIGLGDVNGDSRADLVTVYNRSAYVYPGTADLDFAGGVSTFGGTLDSALFDQVGHQLIAVMDVTGDGMADLVSASTNGNGYVWPGLADGHFGNAVSNFHGTLNSSQHDGVGHEFVMQKKMVRRNGCWSTGCIE